MYPWEEVVGTVVGVGPNHVTLSLEREVSIELAGDEIERWSRLLKVGKEVAFLKVGDGSVRARPIRRGKRNASNSLIVHKS
jgi:hypothetical protein